MPDTPRTRSELAALFADNSSGSISAQDLRDFLASVYLNTENDLNDLIVDLDAVIAALNGKLSKGQNLADLTNVADARSNLGLGSAATHAHADYDPAGAAASAQAAVQANLSTHVADHANPHAVTKAQVGLGNVDNTSDAAKPLSDATQYALNLKANLASPELEGVPTAPTATPGTSTTQIATTEFVAVAAAGADKTYVHDQGPALAVWTVAHGLGKFPSVSVADTTGREVYPQVEFIDVDTVRLTFSSALSGQAYFN